MINSFDTLPHANITFMYHAHKRLSKVIEVYVCAVLWSHTWKRINCLAEQPQGLGPSAPRKARKALADELAALCERIDKEFQATREDAWQICALSFYGFSLHGPHGCVSLDRDLTITRSGHDQVLRDEVTRGSRWILKLWAGQIDQIDETGIVEITVCQNLAAKAMISYMISYMISLWSVI